MKRQVQIHSLNSVRPDLFFVAIVSSLLPTLKELEKKGVKGQILTTNYLDFSEPRALEEFND